MDTPMIVLWTRRAGVIVTSGALGAPQAPRRSERPGEPGALLESPSALVVRWRELDDEGRHPVLPLGERHGIEDLVADAVIVLAAEMCLTPEVVELHGLQRVGDLLLVEALGL